MFPQAFRDLQLDVLAHVDIEDLRVFGLAGSADLVYGSSMKHQRTSPEFLHSSKWKEAAFKTTILHILTGPSMGFHVKLGEGMGHVGRCRNTERLNLRSLRPWAKSFKGCAQNSNSPKVENRST